MEKNARYELINKMVAGAMAEAGKMRYEKKVIYLQTLIATDPPEKEIGNFKRILNLSDDELDYFLQRTRDCALEALIAMSALPADAEESPTRH